MTRRDGNTLLALGTVLGLGGCLERRMTIVSDPPGATVMVNDVEVGRTPVSASFAHYGVYEVRLERDGYEPITTRARASTPVYEWVPLDLLSSVMPFTLSSKVVWRYAMERELSAAQGRDEMEKGLLERAAALRQRVR